MASRSPAACRGYGVIDLSILVCTVFTRYKTFGLQIQHQLWSQFEALTPEQRDRVEILILNDGKSLMLGHKRNLLVDMAQGRHLAFVDDDDRLEPDYLKSLLDATDSGADVITFLVSVSLDGGEPMVCRYSKDFPADENTAEEYHRLPNHICAVKRDLARMVSFPSIPYGEDAGYSKLLAPLLRTERAIDRVLYHYDYSSVTSESQKALSAPLRRRDVPPIVDVIVLSDARSDDLREMTQRTVDTCIAGANSLPVGVTVLEQQPIRYRGAATIHMPGRFHYNAFANHGARFGDADWIMVANNDLVFHDGWLHALLAADHLVVSPRCPRAHPNVGSNITGTQTGLHLAGWCFMIRRSLWELIGGFDEACSFWCSDDVVIEQVAAVGVLPMLVSASRVEHLGSVTLRQTHDPLDELTWKQIDIFNRIYGRHRLADSSEFRAWVTASEREEAR